MSTASTWLLALFILVVISPDVATPPGFGTLRQDDIQMTLRLATIEIRFMPLDPRSV